MLVSISVRLPWLTIDTVGTIMSSEIPDLLDFQKRDQIQNSSVSLDFIGNDDCRAFRHFVKLHLLYIISPFMNAKTNIYIDA